MARIQFSILAVLIVGFFTGCSSQPVTSAIPSQKRFSVDDKEQTKLKKTLIDHEVSVFRWEGGFSEGWVVFREDGEDKKRDLQFDEPLLREFEKEYGSSPLAKDIAGKLTVVRKLLKDESDADAVFDWYECEVRLELKIALPGKGESFRREITVPGKQVQYKMEDSKPTSKPEENGKSEKHFAALISRTGKDDISFLRRAFSDAEENEWLYVKIVDLPK